MQLARTLDVRRSITPERDAAVAGLVERRFSHMGSPLPPRIFDWLGDPNWRWQPHPGAHFWISKSELVPMPLRRRGIYMSEMSSRRRAPPPPPPRPAAAHNKRRSPLSTTRHTLVAEDGVE